MLLRLWHCSISGTEFSSTSLYELCLVTKFWGQRLYAFCTQIHYRCWEASESLFQSAAEYASRKCFPNENFDEDLFYLFTEGLALNDAPDSRRFHRADCEKFKKAQTICSVFQMLELFAPALNVKLQEKIHVFLFREFEDSHWAWLQSHQFVVRFSPTW